MYILRIAMLSAVLSLAAFVCLAQTDPPPATESPAPDEQAAQPVDAAPAPADDLAELFDPAVAFLLQQLWEGTGGIAGGPFTAKSNATFLSQPSGFDVFIISVADVRAAEQSSSSVTVESLVFNDAHHLGQTPLTVSLPAQDYVLAVRSTQRADGFDGECVRQFTRDPITGGRRYDYHLYPLKKERNNYLCFMANFLTDAFDRDSLWGLYEDSDSLFSIAPDGLMELLANSSKAPEELRARIANDLLEYGVAFYVLDRQPYLVKLTLSGMEPVVKEWPVEDEKP